jgi:TfoX/Sxy family transcriptional regulator of competence genes
MTIDEGLAHRIREMLARHKELEIEEKTMFGGLTFMVNGNMCVGIAGNNLLMARVGPEQYEEVMSLPHTKPMDFTKKTMKGFVFVEPQGIEEDEDLEKFVNLSLKFVKTLPNK